MPITLRPFRDADYPGLTAINNAIYTDDGTTVEEMTHFHTKVFDASKFDRLRLVADHPDGSMAAYASIEHRIHEHQPQHYNITIMVDPPAQGQGLGSACYARLLDELRQRQATRVLTNVWEALPRALTFCQQRGFAETKRDLESGLDLASFEFGRFAGAQERVAQQGITITTLAQELRRTPDALHPLHELCSACELDVPSTHQPTPMAYNEFVQQSVDIPSALPDAFFIAKDGEQYVGMTALYQHPVNPQVLYQGLTGVVRSHRKRGIALALKLHGTRYAIDHGYAQIRTDNDAINAAMLGINIALGFQPRPAWIELEKLLA